MRVFVAAELPEGVLEALAETSAVLRGSVKGRYVAPDSFHVTLAFLGEVNAQRVDDACAALERGCEGYPPFTVSLGDFGCFGKRSKATLWQGFDDAGSLSELAADVREELRAEGFSFDEKAFRAHITLMRAADMSAGVLPAPVCARGVVDRITLFRSDLSGSRPAYSSLHTVELRASAK